ncbi:histidine phosphatase family protein [Zhongshania guokunii]|uniref:Histidine phosphatase family protein n=1 Tax=Zhongshania guokunii TaxID=641783 RepID=A0ABV3U7R8_9GAMM
MSEIIVVRHGQAAFGTDDYDRLTEVGWEQARLLGEHLAAAGQPITAVFTGTMRRHRETLAAIRDVLPAVPNATELPGLNEYDFHQLVAAYLAVAGETIDVSDSRAFYRTLRQALMAWSRGDLVDVSEPWTAFEARVKATLARLAAPKGSVLVVSSGGPISAMLREVLKLDVETMVNLNLQAKNTGVTRYFTKGEHFNLNMFNGVAHLDQPATRHLITYT